MENEPNDEKKKDLVPDWSNIDATSFYRSGGASEEKTPPKDLDKLSRETNKFLLFVLIAVVVIFAVAIVTKP